MSDRRLSTSDDELRDLLQDIVDRLYRLENGGAISGLVSFDKTIQIGDVRISIVDTGGLSRQVVFQEVDAGGIAVPGHSATLTL